jgi:nucleotide-binding universal stress UspA family protein
MFQHILVPLDGSQRAEQAIPIAAQVARASGGSLFFLRVVDTLQELGVYSSLAAIYLQEMLEKERIEAAAYLEEITASPALVGIKSQSAVFSGSAASLLLHVAQQEDIDLIVLCSHGYTGFKRWALGSVAQKVARYSPIPILLVREQNLKLKERIAQGIRALVALDGSPFAEAILYPSAHLVAALSTPGQGELHLVQLVETATIEEEFGFMLDDDFNYRQTALRAAGNYLQALRTRLVQDSALPEGVHITWAVEECKDVADALIQMAESGRSLLSQKPSDLIALTTHGRGGLQRWIVGSVTERVLHASTLPLFIVHSRGSAASLIEKKEEASLLAPGEQEQDVL